MCKRLVLICLAIAVIHIPDRLYGQFTDPRTYQNSPVGVNEFELDYSYARANASIDTSIIVAGGQLSLNQGTINYYRYFGFFHRTAWVEASVPLAGLSGSVTGTNIEGSITGIGDSVYKLAMLLRGGPALSVSQFGNYKPTTTVGVSLAIGAPTGQYSSHRILNLGSDRWAFRPEIGVSHPFGPNQKCVLDGYASVYFFTDNTSYHGAEILRQDALPGLEAHISYTFSSKIWASLDTRYSFRGDTFINGINQNNSQQEFTIGNELNIALNSQNSLVFEFARALLHQNGTDYTGFTVKYIYSWGKGYK